MIKIIFGEWNRRKVREYRSKDVLRGTFRDNMEYIGDNKLLD